MTSINQSIRGSEMEKDNKGKFTVLAFTLDVSYVLFLFKLGGQIYFINNLPYWLILLPMFLLSPLIFYILVILSSGKTYSSITFSGGSSTIGLTMLVMLLFKFGGMEALNSVSYWWFFIALFFLKQNHKVTFK